MSRAAVLDVDVLVIGGGPAGSACAIRLAQAGSRVAMVEASDYSRFRIGETLEPSLGPTLRELGLEIGEQDWSMSCPGVAAAWGGPTAARRPALFNPHGSGWCIDRRKFDKALFEQARRAGATAFLETRVDSAVRRAGSWIWRLRHGDGATNGRAKWIVAATGRAARLPLGPQGARTWIDRLVGIALVDDGREDGCDGIATGATVEAARHGWWYSSSLPNGARIAVFFTDTDILPRGNADRVSFLLGELGHCPTTEAACRFAAAMIGQQRWTGFDARSSLHRVALSDGWVAVGDAMMAFDPLCGRGVSEAIAVGKEVADWLCSRDPALDDCPAWAKAAASRFNRYCDERCRTYSIETRWPTSPFWQRRHVL